MQAFQGCRVLIGLVVTVTAMVLVSSCDATSLQYPTVAPTVFELDGPGNNVDDPCFWFDQENPAGSLVFVTTKDSGLVEVFNIATGEFVTSIKGFGRANNCAVAGNLLLTTDLKSDLAEAQPGKVKVHRIPGFDLVRSFAEDTEAPHGIDILTLPDGKQRVYVTDESDASVHVYDLASGILLRTFSTGFGDGIEPILVDDFHNRVFVARGEDEDRRGIGVFGPDGTLLREFGAEIFANDAEGMAIYACGDGGYLIVADQNKTKAEFEIFERVSLEHLGTFWIQNGDGEFTDATDGIDILQAPLPGFPSGVLAVCDGCGANLPDEMDLVSWDRVASTMGLKRCPDGVAAAD